MTQHTPLPWRIVGTNMPGKLEIQWSPPDNRGYKVVCIFWRDGPEDVANARLIAAAPDLLAALQVLVLTPHILYYLEANDPMALEQARAAIAKAIGPQAR